MADLQAGMIYLKSRTSRKMQEVSSTLQSDVMNKVTVNFGHKIFESLQVCSQNWELFSSACVCSNTEKAYEFDRVPGRTGNYKRHI